MVLLPDANVGLTRRDIGQSAARSHDWVLTADHAPGIILNPEGHTT